MDASTPKSSLLAPCAGTHLAFQPPLDETLPSYRTFPERSTPHFLTPVLASGSENPVGEPRDVKSVDELTVVEEQQAVELSQSRAELPLFATLDANPQLPSCEHASSRVAIAIKDDKLEATAVCRPTPSAISLRTLSPTRPLGSAWLAENLVQTVIGAGSERFFTAREAPQETQAERLPVLQRLFTGEEEDLETSLSTTDMSSSSHTPSLLSTALLGLATTTLLPQQPLEGALITADWCVNVWAEGIRWGSAKD